MLSTKAVTATETMDSSSSYIGDVIMIEEDTHEKDLSCRVDVDVDRRIATLESEIASRQAELTRLKSTRVEKNNDGGHMIVNNNKDTAAAIEDTADDDDHSKDSNINDEDESYNSSVVEEEEDIMTIKNEASAVKDTTRLLLGKMAEQYQTNEQLRSDVEQIKNEMGRSLAKVTVENMERSKALEMKDKLYIDLQSKYNDVVMALGEANDDLRRVQMNGNEREEELMSKILKLELDLFSKSSLCPCKEIL